MNKSIPKLTCIGSFEHEGMNLEIVVTQFANGRLAVLLQRGGAAYCRWAINIPSVELARDQFFAKTYDENAPLRAAMLDSGLFDDTGQRLESGFVEFEVWRLRVPLALVGLE